MFSSVRWSHKCFPPVVCGGGRQEKHQLSLLEKKCEEALLTSVQEIYLRSPSLTPRWAAATKKKKCTGHIKPCVFFVWFPRHPGTTACSGAARRAAARASTCSRGCRFTWGLTTARSPSSARRRTVARSSPRLETWRTTGAHTQVGGWKEQEMVAAFY